MGDSRAELQGTGRTSSYLSSLQFTNTSRYIRVMTPDEAGKQLFVASELLDVAFKLPKFSGDPDYDREGETIVIYEAIRRRRIAWGANIATDFDNCVITRLTSIYESKDM